ncbi:MAG: hypothetical protein AAF998_02290 [Bacteroidota bacterium]
MKSKILSITCVIIFLLPVTTICQMRAEEREPKDKNSIEFDAYRMVHLLGSHLEQYVQSLPDDKDFIRKEIKDMFTTDATIQVNSMGPTPTREFGIDDYLNHLDTLGYSRIQLSWGKRIQLLRRVDGGNDELEITFKIDQYFIGTAGRRPGYADATEKTVPARVQMMPVRTNQGSDAHLEMKILSIKAEDPRPLRKRNGA